MNTLELDAKLTYRTEILSEVAAIYSEAQSSSMQLVKLAPLHEAVIAAVKDWQRRGWDGHYNLRYYPSATLQMPSGKSHALMSQAILVVSQVLDMLDVPVDWGVENLPKYSQRIHTATVQQGHPLHGKKLKLTGVLTGIACLRIPDGEPRMVEEQDYRYICPDDPQYAELAGSMA